jgi:hypothetical protein
MFLSAPCPVQNGQNIELEKIFDEQVSQSARAHVRHTTIAGFTWLPLLQIQTLSHTLLFDEHHSRANRRIRRSTSWYPRSGSYDFDEKRIPMKMLRSCLGIRPNAPVTAEDIY